MIRFVLPAMLSLLMLACSGDDDEAPPQASPPEGATATPRIVNGTVVPAATPAPTAASGVTAGPPLEGVFTEPQPLEVLPAELPERPETVFPVWDGASVVLYNTDTEELRDFGPGTLFSPAFAARHLVYVSVPDYEVWLVDLKTLDRRSLGPGTVAYFLGDEHVVINPGDNAFVAINIATDARMPLRDVSNPLLRSMAAQRWGGDFRAFWVAGIYEVRLVQAVEDACGESSPQRGCEARVSQEWLVRNVWTDSVQFEFSAARVEPGAGREIVIATAPICKSATGFVMACHELLSRVESQSTGASDPAYVQGTTNIFVVNVETAETQFVATATYNAATTPWPMNWPLAADENYVAWTESFCGDPQGVTRIFDRTTGEVRELPTGEWVTLNNGRLGIGEFGANALLDVQTLEYISVLPVRGDVSWSRDFKYAAVGQALTHAGSCE